MFLRVHSTSSLYTVAHNRICAGGTERQLTETGAGSESEGSTKRRRASDYDLAPPTTLVVPQNSLLTHVLASGKITAWLCLCMPSWLSATACIGDWVRLILVYFKV